VSAISRKLIPVTKVANLRILPRTKQSSVWQKYDSISSDFFKVF